MLCVGCNLPIGKDNSLRCNTCKTHYCLKCLNVNAENTHKITSEQFSALKCPACVNVNSASRRRNDDSPARLSAVTPAFTMPENTAPAISSANTSQGTLQATDLKKLIKDAFMELFSDDLTGIKKQLSECQESLKFINTSIEDLKKENSCLKKAQSAIVADLKAVKDENGNLRQNLKACESRIKKLEDDNSRQQQWSRLQNVEIIGVPDGKDEVTIDVATKVFSRIGVSIEPKDVDFAHRIQPRRAASAKKGRAIVVRLKDRALRDKIIAAARKGRNMTVNEMGFEGENGYVYVNEHLTIENKALLASCKLKAKELNYRYVWTKNCRIFVRRNDTSPPIPISSSQDLEKIA